MEHVRVLVVVPCGWQEAVFVPRGRLLELALFSGPDWSVGFVAENKIWNVTWDRFSKTLKSTYCSDVRPTSCTRRNYVHKGSTHFTLVKIEHLESEKSDWRTVWIAEKWHNLQRDVNDSEK